MAATCGRYLWLEVFGSNKWCNMCVWVSVWMSVHSWKTYLWAGVFYHVCICMSVCVSGGAKWARAESRKDLCSWHISATVHDGGEGKSMYPCSANYDPSLTPSISLLRLPPGQPWFNDERDGFDYSYTADKSTGRAVVSHRHMRFQTYTDMHGQRHIHPFSFGSAQIKTKTEMPFLRCASVRTDKKNRSACITNI